MPLKEFESILESVLQKNDDEGAQELLIHRMATDRELYSVLFFPHYCEIEFNQFHLDLFKRFKFGERKVRRVSAAPRGAAKSTHETLIGPLHDTCYGTENFVLVVSSTDILANAKLKDIRAEVTSNTDLQDWFGIRFTTKKVAESNFTIVSDYGETYFAARGKGSQVRGIRYKQHRPSKIIFDDFESSDEVANETLRKKTESVYHEEFGKTGNQFTNIEFVGTVLHKDSLLKNLLKNPSYDGALYKAVISWSENEDLWNKWRDIYRNIDNKNRLADALAFYHQNQTAMLKGTKVLWPEKETYYDHMVDMEEIGKRSFFKEKQNDPIGSDQNLFEKIHWYREEEKGIRLESNNELIYWERLKHTCAGAIDPATGQSRKKKGTSGDWACILSGYQDPKGRLLVHHDFTKRISPTKQISSIFDLNEQFNYYRFAVETNLYRNLLLPNIVAERKRLEKERAAKGDHRIIQIPFYDVEQTENKQERIFRLEPKVNHGWIVLNRALSNDFITMLEDFPNNDHDDGPDCLEILWNTVNNVYKPSAMSMDNMGV